MIIAVPIGMLFVNLVNAGVFDTVRESLDILGKDITAFRVYTKKDREYYKRYLAGDREAERKLESQLEEKKTAEPAAEKLTKEKDEKEKKG